MYLPFNYVISQEPAGRYMEFIFSDFNSDIENSFAITMDLVDSKKWCYEASYTSPDSIYNHFLLPWFKQAES